MRELDAEVAEHVFGYKPLIQGEYVSILLDWDDCPHYSTDIAAAWIVVRAIQRRDPMLNLHMTAYAYNRTYAQFNLEIDFDAWSEGNGEHATEEAICRAALLAVGRGAAERETP